MKISNTFYLAIKQLKENKINILYLLLLILVSIIMIVGFSLHKSLINFWNTATEKGYQYNLINISSATADMVYIANDLKNNEKVRDVFFTDEYMSSGTFTDFISDKTNGHVSLIGTIPETKKIKYGYDLSGEGNEIICPDNFIPDESIYLGDYNPKNIIDLRNYLGEEITINYIDQHEIKLKLVGIIDSKYDFSSQNECYVNHSTLKSLNQKYQKELSEYKQEIFLLLNNIKDADEIVNKYNDVEYIKVYTINKELGLKIIKITTYTSFILLIGLVLFTYTLNNRKIINNYKYIEILKICGYTNENIKNIFYLEKILLYLISLIFTYIISKFIIKNISLWFFSTNPYLSFIDITINYKVFIITIIINIIIILLSTTYGLKKIENYEVNEIIYD